MSIKSDYQEYLKKKKTISEKRTGKFWMNQEERYVKPFQIYGNLYYVGDSWVCVHIVDTGEGLLMFDAGNCGATAMLVQSIWEMGDTLRLPTPWRRIRGLPDWLVPVSVLL